MSNAVETSQAVAIFPVRHHSPAASLHVQAMIARLRPKIILIEGPSDATDLIPLLLADGSEPPIAVLCYFQASGDGNQETEERSGPSSLVSPFCAYSPEYVAMRAGQKIGSVLRFCDIPAGAMLEWRAQDTTPRAPSDQPAGEETINEDGSVPQHIVPTLETQLAALADHFDRRDSNEFWDTYFEMSARALNDAAGFTRQMHAYGDLVRDWYEPDEPPMVASAAAIPQGADAGNPEAEAEPAPSSDRPALGGRQIDFDRFRESFMRSEIRRALAEGYKPEEIMVVCGAAHASALSLEGSDFSFDAERVQQAKNAKAATLTLIPYSYARLSEQSGYGAGNRAPAYYQQVWENKGDFASATRKFLLLTMNNMHAKGHAISLADAIEAERLAWTLAAVRDKPAPGLEELEDAARACYGRGALDTAGFLRPLLIGDALGKLSSKVERTPLQQDFYASARRLRIAMTDSPKELRPPLKLSDARELQRSTFLHRLQVASVPLATLKRSGMGNIDIKHLGQKQTVSHDHLDYDHIRNPTELWEVQWSPHTDIRLIELSIEGDRVRDVCARLLRRELDAAQDIGAITKILLRAVLANIPELYNRILRRCDEAVAEGSDLHVLAQAGNHLHQLAQYGTTRKIDPSLLTSLLTRVYTRAALLLPAGAIVGDDEAAKVVSALKLLHELSSRRSDLDASLLNERLALVADMQGNTEGQTDSTVHPSIAGLAATLLLLRGAISQDDLATLMGRRLSGAEEPQRGAQFLEGLLALNRGLLLRNRDIVGWLNVYLQAMSSEAFMHTLPVLRRAMSELSKAEIGVLMTTLAPLLGIKERIQETTLLEPKHLAELRAIDAELTALLAEEL